jgi:hypothetical protein
MESDNKYDNLYLQLKSKSCRLGGVVVSVLGHWTQVLRVQNPTKVMDF